MSGDMLRVSFVSPPRVLRDGVVRFVSSSSPQHCAIIVNSNDLVIVDVDPHELKNLMGAARDVAGNE